MIDYEEFGIKIIEKEIGSGGSAVVHKAEVLTDNFLDIESGKIVAVKEFYESILKVDNQVERIRQEAAIGKTIDSEMVAKTYGIIETNEKKFALVMEYIEGEDLSKWASRQRRDTAWSRWKQIAIDICDGVMTLHNNGVFHRDIKPENIFIVKDRAIVMDIGIACMAEPNEHTMHTQVKDFIGSIRYTSPQFLRGEEYSSEDDVYMIGATFLELFSGKRPFHDIERKIVIPISMLSTPPKIDKLREKIPGTIKILVNGALNPERSRRPTLTELKSSLLDPEKSEYIQRELNRQSSDVRSYPILKITSEDGGFFADIGNDKPELYADYVIVRREQPINVPSLGVEVEPEKWIADVEMRHYKQGVGYFKLIGKRWVESNSSFHSLAMLGTGHWEEYDKKVESVKIGDIVQKKVKNG